MNPLVHTVRTAIAIGLIRLARYVSPPAEGPHNEPFWDKPPTRTEPLCKVCLDSGIDGQDGHLRLCAHCTARPTEKQMRTMRRALIRAYRELERYGILPNPEKLHTLEAIEARDGGW